MSVHLREGHRVFVYREPIDFRAGFDKLAMIVREKMKLELLEGDLFLFLGRNRRRLKSLCFDGTGLILITKRLEKGRFMSVEEFEEVELTVEELNQVLSGNVVRKRYFGAQALQKCEVPISSSHGLARERIQHRSAPRPGDSHAR